MPKSEIRKLLQEIKKQVDNPGNSSTTEIKKMASEAGIDEQTAEEIYHLLTEFYQAVEEHGGIEKYMHSNISWLKIELELLSACYQIAILEDMKVLDISEMLSLNDLRIFPKTPSQLQNTYYKLKKELIQVEDIPKNKPGRKRKTQKIQKKKKPIFSAKLCQLNSKHQRPSKNKSATTNHAKKTWLIYFPALKAMFNF